MDMRKYDEILEVIRNTNIASSNKKRVILNELNYVAQFSELEIKELFNVLGALDPNYGVTSSKITPNLS